MKQTQEEKEWFEKIKTATPDNICELINQTPHADLMPVYTITYLHEETPDIMATDRMYEEMVFEVLYEILTNPKTSRISVNVI